VGLVEAQQLLVVGHRTLTDDPLVGLPRRVRQHGDEFFQSLPQPTRLGLAQIRRFLPSDAQFRRVTLAVADHLPRQSLHFPQGPLAIALLVPAPATTARLTHADRKSIHP